MANWSQSVGIEQWTWPMLKHHGFPIFTDGSDNLGFPMSFPNSKLNPNSIGVQQPEYSFPLLVTTIKNVNLPAQESVSVALIVDGVWCVSVWGPLEDPGLAFLAVQTERSLISTKWREEESGLSWIFLPLAEPSRCRRPRSPVPQLLHTRENPHLSPFLCAFKLITAFGVVSYVERVISSRELLVISALNNKCVSLAAHNVDLRDEEAVDVPVGEEYNKFFWFSNI